MAIFTANPQSCHWVSSAPIRRIERETLLSKCRGRARRWRDVVANGISLSAGCVGWAFTLRSVRFLMMRRIGRFGSSAAFRLRIQPMCGGVWHTAYSGKPF